MIDRDFVKAQIGRLSGLSFFPTTDEGVKELYDAGQSAEREQTLRQVVDDFLREVTECPKPVEIRRAIAAEDDRGRSWQPPKVERRIVPEAMCACKGFLNVLNSATGRYESCTCEFAQRRSFNGQATIGQVLADSMNRHLAFKRMQPTAQRERGTGGLRSAADVLGPVMGDLENDANEDL